MRQEEKYTLERQTKRSYLMLRFKNGLHELMNNRLKGLIIWIYLIITLFAWLFKDIIFAYIPYDIYATADKKVINIVFPVCMIAGLIFLIIVFGTPLGFKRINENLWRIGLVNHAGETPLLIKKRKYKKIRGVKIMEFKSNGIPQSEWENQQDKIETALNIHIVKIVQGTDKKRIIIYTVSGNRNLPETIYWKDEYLSDNSFELVLGESLLGIETVNLAQIPHMLLGGSTGSGKSVLLKLLIMQCIKKGATVFIADFKGGVDFPLVWQSRCRIVIEKKELVCTLNNIIDILEERKGLLFGKECANIDEYNSIAGNTLPRMIFACDEVAELLDKTGLSKDDKDLVTQIEGNLSIIARQGRAFGLHLILATQRPDATILTGQIRNNIDFRVCGRADNVLSQIILDNTGAADKIPKDAQGRFLTNDGIIFQGYLFDERKTFEKEK
ncbi:MAG: DUF87 domain-containing protein [Oscillospiraceae bacterium]|nr:DUF87 domain-containing protein [Oscillospiraceae bacterium]